MSMDRAEARGLVKYQLPLWVMAQLRSMMDGMAVTHPDGVIRHDNGRRIRETLDVWTHDWNVPSGGPPIVDMRQQLHAMRGIFEEYNLFSKFKDDLQALSLSDIDLQSVYGNDFDIAAWYGRRTILAFGYRLARMDAVWYNGLKKALINKHLKEE